MDVTPDRDAPSRYLEIRGPGGIDGRWRRGRSAASIHGRAGRHSSHGAYGSSASSGMRLRGGQFKLQEAG